MGESDEFLPVHYDVDATFRFWAMWLMLIILLLLIINHYSERPFTVGAKEIEKQV